MTVAIQPENRGTFFGAARPSIIVAKPVAQPTAIISRTYAPAPVSAVPQPKTPTSVSTSTPVYALPQPAIPTSYTPAPVPPSAIARIAAPAPAQAITNTPASQAASTPVAFSSAPATPAGQNVISFPAAPTVAGELPLNSTTIATDTATFPWWIILVVAAFFLVSRSASNEE